ncbi:uncharacterized protein [Macrobrachium rosenbergii]|uniref:uncharacterized protein n=1 Tax=Macrobrachium rosenbergii TaxID=79674 RepID=UPI0034D515AD
MNDVEPVPTAGEEKEAKALDFPGVRFADENITTRPEKESQVVIESLKENTVKDERSKEEEEEPEAVAEVDWLGVPLATSTLPDFVSMYRKDYPGYSRSDLHVEDPRKIVRKPKRGGRQLYEQFEGVGWVQRDTVPMQAGGYVKQGGEVGKALLHPQGDLWTTPPPVVDRIRKNDPMEYLNLCDPHNKIQVEKAIYQWVIRDMAAMDERTTVGPAVRTSGFTANSSPHLPPVEDRNFRSIYYESYNEDAQKDDVEGLHPSLIGTGVPPALRYPGYSGTAVMDDTPFAYLRLNPHVLRTQPDVLRQQCSHHLVQRHKEFSNS